MEENLKKRIESYEKCSRAVYLACEESVASDISGKFKMAVSDIQKLEAENKRLESELSNLVRQNLSQHNAYELAVSQNKRLREGLEFYANPEHWNGHVCDKWSGLVTAFGPDKCPNNDIEVINDEFKGGKLARQILTEMKEG